jgi:hypothetical protein
MVDTHKWYENDGRRNLADATTLSYTGLLGTKLVLLTIHGISLDDFGPCPSEDELMHLLTIPWPCWAFSRAGMARIDVRREARAAREARAIFEVSFLTNDDGKIFY